MAEANGVNNMATIEEMRVCIGEMARLKDQSRLLPQGIVAGALCVSKQRLDFLVRDGVIDSECVSGCRLVVVGSALNYARRRFQRSTEGRLCVRR